MEATTNEAVVRTDTDESFAFSWFGNPVLSVLCSYSQGCSGHLDVMGTDHLCKLFITF